MPPKQDTRSFKTLILCGRCGVCTACKLLAAHPKRYGPGGQREFVFGSSPLASRGFVGQDGSTTQSSTVYADAASVTADNKIPALPCVYEGTVRNACVTCSGITAEVRHVRSCNHPTTDRDFCTRERIGGSIPACVDCGDNPNAVRAESILITGGIGDALAVDSMLTPEDRSAIKTIYLASPAGVELFEIFTRLPNYGRLTRVSVIPIVGTKAYYSLKDVAAAGHSLPQVSDWSIRSAFPKLRPYYTSSLLTTTLCVIPKPVPGPYVVVCPYSQWGAWPGRGFTAGDWNACASGLADRGLVGVVLGGARKDAPPGFVNLQGTTSIIESIEILKMATGYAGIDSWPSVLASKLFPADRLTVKTVSAHCRKWAKAYFAPRTQFPFLLNSVRLDHWSAGA